MAGQTAYQAGVFMARSLCLPLLGEKLVTPWQLAMVQVFNLILAYFAIRPFTAYHYLLAFMWFEGIVGGMGYVLTYTRARKAPDSEWIMSRLSLADTMGILTAGIVSSVLVL